MPIATSVPPIEFTPTGLVLPEEADILAGVQSDFNAAFGGALNPALETPQGQLATSLTAIIGDSNDQFALFVNQVDPAYAAGRMQDAIGRLYFIERNPALPTAVQCDCIGLVGTVIPVGALAVDTDNNIYSCVQAGIIPAGGTISLSFACTATGAIACPAGQLNRIYQAIPGWDAINNPGDGVPGRDVESRVDFEDRRRQSVALNSRGSLQAVKANVLAVDNVLDVYVTENVTNATRLEGTTNYALAPHSLYIAVVGGAAADVAAAIWLKKSPGCNYNGNTSVTVYDDFGYEPPYPSYVVKYQIPATVGIKFAVQISQNLSLPTDIVAQVKAAIINAFAGGDGGPRARIGSTIYASRYYAPIAAISPFVGIVSLLIGTGTPAQNVLTLGIDQAPTVTEADITVTLA